ncbi:HaeIII family restriction endonuclease [Lysinibacillus fusiformis]
MALEKTNTSNRNGRAFEAIVFHELVELLKTNPINTEMPMKTYERQKMDSVFFNELKLDSLNPLNKDQSSDLKVYNAMVLAATEIAGWIVNNSNLNFYTKFILIKPEDHAGKLGDVSDIKIEAYNQTTLDIINFSLKHNSTALKHSRLSGVPEWLGIPTESDVYITYTEDLEKNWIKIQQDILEYQSKHNDIISSFSDLNKIAPNYKYNYSYEANYRIATSLFNAYKDERKMVEHLFKYLVGENYYKINLKSKLKKPKIEILRFLDVPLPSSYTVSRNNKGYIILSFNNGWIISLRLHSAATKLSKSLKFDAKLTNTRNVLPAPIILEL